MSFEAKYPGRCGECREPITPGDEITYSGGVVVHNHCAVPGATGNYLDGYVAQQARPAKVCTRCHLEVVVVNDGVCLDCS